ncbi:MAG: CRP-like cAMP-binding protein [Bradymonadia bacterium]|jgi:CRP-like cAMP-binding protein
MAAREFAEGQVMIAEDAVSDALYFVLGGSFGVFIATGETNSLRVSGLTAGDWVGEVSFVDPGVASATVRAEEPALVLELRAHDLGILIDDAPDVASDLLGRLCEELAERLLAVGSAKANASGDRLEMTESTGMRRFISKILGGS